MTVSATYLQVLATLSPHSPLDLDPMLFAKGNAAGDLAIPHQTEFAPSQKLWARDQTDVSYLGIRVTAPLVGPHDLAATLAATAVERQIIPIFLSWIGPCGMQRFGFRVEQITGATQAERQRAEGQVQRLWALAAIVDAGEVTGMS